MQILKTIKLTLLFACLAVTPMSAQSRAEEEEEIDEIGNFDFLYTDEYNDSCYNVLTHESLMDEAFALLGTRYRAGSSSPNGFDCSGFTSYVFRQMGIELNRSSRGQYTQGQAVKSDNLQTGDLVFFTSPGSGRGIGHVGIVVDFDPMSGAFSFIHASRKGVKVSQSTEPFYSRRYVGARRVLQQ